MNARRGQARREKATHDTRGARDIEEPQAQLVMGMESDEDRDAQMAPGSGDEQNEERGDETSRCAWCVRASVNGDGWMCL